MHITKWKKPIWKGYLHHDSTNMTFWKRNNYGHSKNISVVATYHFTFIKIECSKPRLKPKMQYKPLVITMY
jgi:hypothetical protein